MHIVGRNSEQRIVRLFDRGDASAMNSLYAAYADYLMGVCARYVPDENDQKDVLQETFIHIFTQIDTFEYRGNGSLKAWMTRIAVNESLAFLRKQAKTRLVETEGIDTRALLTLIQQLPTGYRTVFNLYAIEGKSHQEIAQLLGIKADTSASQYHRARSLLAKSISAYKSKASTK